MLLSDITQNGMRMTSMLIKIPVHYSLVCPNIYYTVSSFLELIPALFKIPGVTYFFTEKLTKKVKGIKKFQHFRFTSDHPGKVFARSTCDGVEKTFTLVRKNSELQLKQGFPGVIPPPGLPAERQQYLYEKIREFYPEEVKQ